MTADELLAAVRSGGKASLADAYAVVLETDGSFSVLEGPKDGEADRLLPVTGAAARIPARRAPAPGP